MERKGLTEDDVLIVIDWKENGSLPLASTETGDMFWTKERKEFSIFGACVYQNVGGCVRVKKCLFATEILDHDVSMSTLMVDEVLQHHVVNLPIVKRISFWSDCGPHFRAYQFLGHVEEVWVPKYKCTIRINYFAEKHGKGVCDGLFAEITKWLGRCLKQPGIVIDTIDGFVRAMRSESESDMVVDPPSEGGVEYFWKEVESDQRPPRELQVLPPDVPDSTDILRRGSSNPRRSRGELVQLCFF